jgi:hypothetical protein
LVGASRFDAPLYGGVFYFQSPPPVIGLDCHKQTVTKGGLKAVKEIFIAALGPALVLLVSELFRCLHARNERQERFFYEMYPKRLELYEEILQTLASLDDIEKAAKAESSFEISAVYAQTIKRLFDLNLRCRLFGSGSVTAAFNALAETLVGQDNFIHGHEELFGSETVAFVLLDTFTETVSARKGAIMALIQAEANADFIDKKIFNIAPVLKKKKNKPEKKTEDPR